MIFMAKKVEIDKLALSINNAVNPVKIANEFYVITSTMLR